MPIGRLAQVLRGIHDEDDPRLLVGPTTFDDAGVVRIDPHGDPHALALVQTVDFFPPVVDDPELYGAIAAANALSDVYAMGGKPLSALCLAGFPRDFPDDWVDAIFRGGFSKVREAGAVVAGGHTVESDVQFGFSVTGLVDPSAVTSNTGCREGDQLYLTKQLGMGTLTTASKRELISWEQMLPAAHQMATLNNLAGEAMACAGSRGATDVTGFGLLGHGRNLAKGSELTLHLSGKALPIFEGALSFAAEGVASGGSRRNRTALAHEVRVADDVDEALATVCFDAETSGGLLIAVPEGSAAILEAELKARGQLVAHVGEMRAKSDVFVELTAG